MCLCSAPLTTSRAACWERRLPRDWKCGHGDAIDRKPCSSRLLEIRGVRSPGQWCLARVTVGRGSLLPGWATSNFCPPACLPRRRRRPPRRARRSAPVACCSRVGTASGCLWPSWSCRATLGCCLRRVRASGPASARHFLNCPARPPATRLWRRCTSPRTGRRCGQCCPTGHCRLGTWRSPGRWAIGDRSGYRPATRTLPPGRCAWVQTLACWSPAMAEGALR
mmetsp:Transcript_105000/g.282226  ORF Transcript_105000/g.282226 Transcript_105000/m.282226 type:complete len:223 (+) Transcript_105000:278-946(+)